MREAALIADVSRQRVWEWCNSAGIDPVKARSAWIAGIMLRLDRKRR